ncbi:MAG: hypothetical protein Q9159_007203 [Coniocarpon cinnabarinum]
MAPEYDNDSDDDLSLTELDPRADPHQTSHAPTDAEDGALLVPEGQHLGPHKRKGISSLLDKFRSEAQTEVEEAYDPSTNRHVHVGNTPGFPSNIVSNAKYTAWSFLPRTLYNEFSFFFNLYFLLVALSQVIPQLRIGYLSTYIAPLAFVLTITLGKEAIDDITRRRRDAELNSERYTVLAFDELTQTHRKSKRRRDAARRLSEVEEEEQALQGDGEGRRAGAYETLKMSKDLKVGDVLKLEKGQRVPADAVILKSVSSENAVHDDKDEGEVFIRTDQLDGETDWKLRIASPASQSMDLASFSKINISAAKPSRKVNEFLGTLNHPLPTSLDTTMPGHVTKERSVALSIDNTAWANTVLASTAVVYAVIIYTGPQTRQAMSTSASRTKTGLLEYEINNLTKILCGLTLLLSFILVAAYKFESPDKRPWYIAVMRYLILFSTIVPISLRVNLDMGKSVYAWFMHRDKDIPGTIVRTSTIPEDLGRIEYLLSDKTGTLTQNDMQLKKIHVGTVSYGNDSMSEISNYIRQGFGSSDVSSKSTAMMTGNINSLGSGTRSRREISSRVRDVVLALALCHNVTPTVEDINGKEVTAYQASSPDEIAIIRWTESCGLRLTHRDRHSMTLESTHSGEVVVRVEILSVFPFTSESKRMGIIVKFLQDPNSQEAATEETPVWFFQKGADTVMSSIVARNDWLDEETANMAREGLRTLVVGRKKLSAQQYHLFTEEYKDASLSLHNRDEGMAQVVGNHLERDLELLGVTGVEDKLQNDVKPSLELLRNAGVKIWMLTGDKVETARCVAVSSKLVARGQYIHTIAKMSDPSEASDALSFLRSTPSACLLIDGDSLALMLHHHRTEFIATAMLLPCVVACRCSPTQKADIAKLIRTYTGKRTCAIGDGGNDVSMIQAADVGLGIVGKEGRQASLAADFSITQFAHLTKLLVWHGRNSYKRSAKLAQFVMHRGLIISVCQTVFSITDKYEPKALYKDWLLVGYATIYTMFPVFSLVLDTDIPPRLAHVYPELYSEMKEERSLSYRTFFAWCAISIYQGCAIQILAHFLDRHDGPHMVSVSYTALILNELVMVAAEVTTWHWIMVVTILGTLAAYAASLPFLGEYFDVPWLWSVHFGWRVAVCAVAALLPVWLGKCIQGRVKPPSYRKVQQGL